MQNTGILLFIVDEFVTTQATVLPHIFKKSCMTQSSGTNELFKAQLCFSACPYKLDKAFPVRSHSFGGAGDCNILNASQTEPEHAHKHGCQ